MGSVACGGCWRDGRRSRRRSRALLDAARHGSGGALVVRGVAGSGKSTLLADAVAARCGHDGAAHVRGGVRVAAGVRRAAAAAVAACAAASTALPGAAAGRAARRLGRGRRRGRPVPGLPRHAEPARRRRRGGAGAGRGRRRALARRRLATAALLFVARRLQAERVALLFAARDGDARRFDAPDLPTVVLGGVTGADADALLRPGRRATVDAGGARPAGGRHRRQPARAGRAGRRAHRRPAGRHGRRCRARCR